MSRMIKSKLRVSRALSSLGVGRDWVLSRRVADRHARDFDQIERYLMFAGYPRSGHSLVGSLLNAHPDVVVSHQLDALRYVERGFSRSQLFGMIFLSDARFEKKGRTGTKREYDYAVPGQWQGRYRTLRVIGDKRGKNTSQRIGADPELLDRVSDLVDVPLRFLHVVRNPYDNIATMTKRAHSTLERTADRFFALADGVVTIRSRVPAEAWHDLRHESLIADARSALEGVCRFLDIEPHGDYLDACAGMIYQSPHRSRFDLEWSPELIDEVARRASAYDFFDGYVYEEEPAGRP
jgi:hypothetical protein